MKILMFFAIIFFSLATNANDRVFQIAKNNIASNIIEISGKQYLSAGKNQFRSLWTRDFCFSAEGLLLLGHDKVVKDHLDFLIANRRKKDDLIPLYMDSISPMIRVVTGSINSLLNSNIELKSPSKLKPYYLINGQHPSIDANILTLYASMKYLQKTNDQEWYQQNLKNLLAIFKYYEQKKTDGIIYQTAHSDWQDSAKRVGFSFFTNILYYQVAEYFKFIPKDELRELKDKIHSAFYDPSTGIYLSMLGKKQYSLDGNLWAIEYNIFNNAETLYLNLLNSNLLKQFGLLGNATYPSYNARELYLQVRISKLNEYHGKLYWSWLLNKSAKVSLLMNDHAQFKIQNDFLQNLYLSNKDIQEVYDPNKEYAPFTSTLYDSEKNFTWGSSTYIELYNLIKNQ